MKQILFVLFVTGLVIGIGLVAEARTNTKVSKQKQGSPQSSPSVSRAPGSVNDSDKVFEVRGQSRNLSMMLVLKNRKDNLEFVKARENYANEIKETSY